ncbi:alpha/beta hydrolase [Chitinophaga sp.]|uniref:alpha/beta hydrolase family protein n=1 Tax=Chitinophaga sp. TaxID=1869181 RepID=UPI002621D0B5|nr:alpha/beta hydrolase [uncultured Chitinophaga sp.]
MYKYLLMLGLAAGTAAHGQERPQHPQPPYPYYSEDVTFDNTKDGFKMAGTFTRPEAAGKYPAVILVSGSGPQDRDSDIFGHKSFLVLADHLTRNGIAVLRYDDRGTNKSGGEMKGSDITGFTRDAQAAMQYLRSRPDVDAKKAGIIGHSEGGAIGQIMASEDPGVAFLVSLAGPGVDGATLIMSQTEAILRLYQLTDTIIQMQLGYQRAMMDAIVQEKDTAALRARIMRNASKQYNENPNLKAVQPEEFFVRAVSSQYMSPEYLSIVRFDPKPYFAGIKCPVLALNGDKDIQVVSSVHLAGWKNGVKQAEIRELPGLNHLFQKCNSCQVSEYKTLTETISPAALDVMSKWIRQTTGLAK